MQRRLRLRRGRDFQRLRREGKTWAHPYFVLSVAPNQLPHNRYGIITTRKLGNAVARNRVRRRVREVFRYWHPQLQPGHDVVLIMRSGAKDCPYSSLLDAAQSLLRRAALFMEP
jgi:ribonuclease P protein component